MQNEREQDDLYYLCSLIEYTARKTHNYTADIVQRVGKQELKRQLELAEVNHCLSFEQLSDELIEFGQIPQGQFDSVANCKGEPPRFLSIGKMYARLVEDVMQGDVVETLYNVFTSFLSYEIANYNTALYYSGRSYLKACYEDGRIVA